VNDPCPAATKTIVATTAGNGPAYRRQTEKTASTTTTTVATYTQTTPGSPKPR
jgi:hypothetical protein